MCGSFFVLNVVYFNARMLQIVPLNILLAILLFICLLIWKKLSH